MVKKKRFYINWLYMPVAHTTHIWKIVSSQPNTNFLMCSLNNKHRISVTHFGCCNLSCTYKIWLELLLLTVGIYSNFARSTHVCEWTLKRVKKQIIHLQNRVREEESIILLTFIWKTFFLLLYFKINNVFGY